MNRVFTKIWSRHSLWVVYLLLIAYACAYIFPALIAFLWQIKSPFVRDYFALSQSFFSLLDNPWTLLTYSFFHGSFGHWFFNVIMLYFVGVLFMNLFSPKRFLWIYFASVIVGGLCFVFTYEIFPVFAYNQHFLLGASAGIMGVLVFLATHTPSYRIYLFGILALPLWSLAVLLLVIDLVSIPISNAGGHIAHLGGALAGFLYALSLKCNFSFKFLHKGKTQAGQPTEKAVQARVDSILDKITKSGYDSLTQEEKKYLFIASKEAHQS